MHDRMTEQIYTTPIVSFKSDIVPAKVQRIPVMTEGRAALEAVNNVKDTN